ncbi:hypothetical protein C8R48DRAFT_675987 [Suillus tomentosus]|nr:hypothetical protein C8R48DRAFT_675987 [Suillus tomentosus]
MEGRSEVGRRQRQVSGSTRNVVVGCAIPGLWKGEEGLVLAYQGSERLQDVALGAWVLSKYKLRVRATAQRRQGAGSRSGNQGAVVRRDGSTGSVRARGRSWLDMWGNGRNSRIIKGGKGPWLDVWELNAGATSNEQREFLLKTFTTEGEEEAVIVDDDEEKENRIEVFDLRNCQRGVHPRAKEGLRVFGLFVGPTQPFPNERNISIPYWYYRIIVVAAHSTISAEILQQNEASTQTGRMLACLIPPSSIGELSPALEDSVESYRLMSCNVKTPGSNSPNLAERKLSHHTNASSGRFTRRPPLSPSSDTSESSEDELHALPRLPHLKNLSHYVQRAKRQFKPYDRRRGHGPNAIELRFFQRTVRKYSGETELSLVDVQEGKELFERGMRGMSLEATNQAVVAMQATRECKRLRALTTAWEIESSVQHTKLFEKILEQDALEYAQSAEEASSFKKMLVGRTLPDLEGEVDFNIGAFSRDLTSFVVADVQLDHMECLVRDSSLPEDDDSSLSEDDAHMEGGSPDSDSEVEFDS